MSLLTQASLILTPNATKASKLYSIIPSNGNGDMTVVRATTATRVNSLGLIENVASNVARLNYDGGVGSLLIEPQRTNKLQYSNVINNSVWTNGNIYGTINYGISPDGSQNSNRILFTGINQAIFQYYNGTLGEINSFSIWLKGINGQTIQVGQFGNFVLHTFNGNWQYLKLENKTTINNLTVQFTTYSGATALDFQFFGAQIELGSFATSYIPTVATSVTRNADLISKTGISDLIGQTEGTLFIDFKNNALDSSTKMILKLWDGTDYNRIQLSSFASTLFFYIMVGGVVQINLNHTPPLLINNEYKIAIVYGNNNYKAFINGVNVLTNSSLSVPNTSALIFGNSGLNALFNSININSAQLYKTSLTDAECITLTTL